MKINRATIIIIIVTVIIYSIAGTILFKFWPKKCEPGKTSSSIKPIEQNDIIPRKCQSIWTHDYDDSEKWTQHVIDVVTNGIDGKNCWDERATNNVTVSEIYEYSPNCQNMIGKTKTFNYAEMVKILLTENWTENSFNLAKPTEEQKEKLIKGCVDCDITLYVDSIDDQDTFDERITDRDCFNPICTTQENCPSNQSKCWGPCHGVCGEDEGEKKREWKLKQEPGPGGRVCEVKDDILKELQDNQTFKETDTCNPDSCPGCCNTLTKLANVDCNQHSGEGSRQDSCINTAYDIGQKGPGKCQWTNVSGDDNKLFGFDDVCRYRDVVTNSANAIGAPGLAETPFDMRCRWVEGAKSQGTCLPMRDLLEHEMLNNQTEITTPCVNDELWGNYTNKGTCDNDFDITKPDRNKIFAAMQTGWASPVNDIQFQNEDDGSMFRCSDFTDATDCNKHLQHCAWLEPKMGKCAYTTDPSEILTKSHKENMHKICERQHAINTIVQLKYLEADGECIYPESGLRISLTSIPNYGPDGVEWKWANSKTEARTKWLWPQNERRSSTKETAAWLKNDKSIWQTILPDYDVSLTGDIISQEHPIVDGSTDTAKSYIVNHYSSYIPEFIVKLKPGKPQRNSTTGLVQIKNALQSKDFKNSLGFKIVVSNLDDMVWDPVSGKISYNKVTTSLSDWCAGGGAVDGCGASDGAFVDKRQCMVQGSKLSWNRHSDGDHPVIDGYIWVPVDYDTALAGSKVIKKPSRIGSLIINIIVVHLGAMKKSFAMAIIPRQLMLLLYGVKKGM